jgi:alpha-amylase
VIEAHKREILVMIDVVFNHIGYVNNDDFSGIVPFNKPSYYHEPCDITDEDYQNNNRERIEKCRIFGLPDINTESEEVKQIFFNWIGDNVIAKYGFDALRIDTVRHINMRFW